MSSDNIGIIIPCKNDGQQLSKMLQCLSAQVNKDFTLYIVDGSDCQNQIDIIKASIDSFVSNKLLNINYISYKNGLPGSSRNQGFLIASKVHEWIGFLDVGTYPDSEWLFSLIKYVKKNNSNHAYSVCRFFSKNINGRAVCSLSYGIQERSNVLPGLLIKSESFFRVGLFRSDLRAGEDKIWMKSHEQLEIRSISNNSFINYTDFPESFYKVVSKWCVYSANDCYAVNLASLKFMIYLLQIFLFTIGFIWPYIFLIYLMRIFTRAIFLPHIRSKEFSLFSENPLMIFLLFYFSTAMEIGRIIGIFLGLIKKLKSSKRLISRL